MENLDITDARLKEIAPRIFYRRSRPPAPTMKVPAR